VVQPVDIQSLIGNIMATDRVQHIVERQAAGEQQRIAFQTHAERARQETQVRETHEAESERIEEEQEGQSERRRHRRQQQRGRDESAEPEESGTRTAVPVSEQPVEVRTVYNSSEEKEDLGGPEGHNLDVRV